MSDVSSELHAINKTLERHNEIAQKTLDVMQKSDNKPTRILKAVVLIAGALTLLGSIDIIRKWIIGG